ncbi:MAG: hypothetical protein ACE5D8_03930 [Fidelibacterota bacterium]
MPWTEHLKFDKSQKAVQSFGLVLSGIIFAVGVYRNLVLHREFHGEATLAILLVISALFFQQPLRLVYYPWMVIVRIIGFIILHFILLIVYFTVITMIGLILQGRRALKNNRRPDPDTYWIRKDNPPNMERMF